ncbi:family 16 glycoside hydrolase [Luteitalea sp.]|jgi:hypothetical protein|uniref:family 16 glycoside hydrolase n=1 Tax=Luteitalea sp. TaxID=2004800 RepID=UPI0037C68F1A
MRLLRTLPIALAVSAALVSSAFAQPTPRPKLPGEDWVQIFNGKDLTGWQKIGDEQWNVEPGGILHGVAVTKAYGYLKTEKNYKDFQLSMHFKCDGDGNSGVFFHSEFKPGTPTITQGLQFEIDCQAMHHTGGLYGDGRNWIVWPAPENEMVVRRGEWNEYVLTVVGNRYIARLNGVQVVDFTDPQPKSFDGGISLQLHSGGTGDMKFREIWLRDLTQR